MQTKFCLVSKIKIFNIKILLQGKLSLLPLLILGFAFKLDYFVSVVLFV